MHNMYDRGLPEYMLELHEKVTLMKSGWNTYDPENLFIDWYNLQ